MPPRTPLILLTCALLASCGGDEERKPNPPAEMPMAGAPGEAPRPVLFGNLGTLHRAVSTSSKEAQTWFDQGLALYYAYNHDEAIRSFREVARLDDSCAMAWWGIALANGPHINNPALDPAHAKAAWEALALAKLKAPEASAVERDLIEALSKRYAKDPAAERAPLDGAYADAMREAWKRHGEDPDVGALFAEAMMDLRPWALWTPEGSPEPGTNELLGVLETVLAAHPDHPAANHFYVHAVEASSTPEKALASADRLRTLVPGAGHLVHMPAHVYMRVGRYADAAEANRRAIAVDADYLAKAPPPDFYTMYVAHNYQFLCAASMMEGRSAESVKAATDMVALVPPEMREAMAPMVDGVLSLPWAALARFGRWEEILKEPALPEKLPLTYAMWRFVRGYALAATGRFDEAEKEQVDLVKRAAAVPPEAKMGLTPAKDVFAVAIPFLAGEIAARRGLHDEAIRLLTEAAAAEDRLHYDEPSDWLLPARHSLGAVLLAAGRPREAAGVYLDDLKRNPENGWALFGLEQALRAEQHDGEAMMIRGRFEKAWARADVTLTSSRF